MHSWPCRLDVGASTSGAELIDWLTDHVGRSGLRAADLGTWWTADGDDVASAPRVSGLIRAGDTIVLSPDRPIRAIAVELVASESGAEPIATLGPGVYRVGGGPDADVSLAGSDLPGDAAVLEVHASGAVDVRRRAGIDGGDEDTYFGSPTDGRAIQFSAADIAGPVGGRFQLGSLSLLIRRASGPAAVRRRGPVNRTPYRPVREGVRRLEELPPPPSAPRASRMAITSIVVPLASGVGMAVLLGRLQFLLIVLLAPIALGVVHAVERRRGRRTFAAERARYRELTAARAAEAAREAEAARVDAHRALPRASTCLDVALNGGVALWQRAVDGPHLLRARVGETIRPAVVDVAIGAGGDDELRAEARADLDRACRPPGPVPADIDLDDTVVVGVCGEADTAVGLVRSLLAQFVTHHGPEDVLIGTVLSAGALGAFEGISWLPHARSEASPMSSRPVAVWADDVDRLMGTVIELAARRSVPGAGRELPSVPRVVLVVDQRAAVDRGSLARLLDLAPRSGIRVIWFGDDPSLLPRQCRTTVHVFDDAGSIESTDPAVALEACTIECMDGPDFARLSRCLAPRRDAASPTRSGALPSTLTLRELLTDAMSPSGVASAWHASDGSSLAAPIGVSGDGPLTLDLVTHGPHALVAGTSGSGKSELLQTWVASMAAHHPPERCTFLFVDYKGGATAGPLVDLPHTVGSVTNLDSRLAQRALVSLRAELDRRMAILSGRAKDLREFATLVPAECPPRLVIVVDEFATLVKEIPDFVSGVVDVAQRGRSLGIHLVLATQRPAGAVNDDILANTTVRIALRVVDGADSRSVIGTDDAAAISPARRGQAFVRLGPGAIGGVQVARSSAPITRQAVTGGVIRMVPTPPPPSHADDGGRSQLSALVSVVAQIHDTRGGRRPRRPWVPELPSVVGLSSIVAEDSSTDAGRFATMGVADDPAHQRRRPVRVDLESSGGLVVFGTGGSGRTTALRTAAVSLVEGAAVDAVQLVVFDFAGRALRALADLPHARAVVTGDDLEGACREIERLDHELERRRALLGRTRAEAWSALAGRPDRPPRLCVVVDGFAGLRAGLDSAAGHPWWDRLVRVLVDGRQVGIHPLLAADRRNDLPAALLGSVGERLVLRMAEPEAMTTLGVPRAVARSAELPVGRGFLNGHEVQVAVLDQGCAEGPSGTGEAAAVRVVAERCPHPPVLRAPGLPRSLDAWPDGVDPTADERGVPIGVDEDGDLVHLPLAGVTLVAGPRGSGRSNVGRLIVDRVDDLAPRGMRVVCVADDRSPLSACRSSPGLHVVADARSAADVLSSPAEGSGFAETLLLVDDIERFDSPPFASIVVDWMERGRPAVLTAERNAVARSLTGMLGQLRRLPRMLILQPEHGPDVEALTGRRVRFRPGTTFPAGRAIVVSAGGQRHVQLKFLKSKERY